MKQSILPGAAALLMTIAVGARADSIYYTLDATTKGLKFTAEASRYQGKYEAFDYKYTIKSPRDAATGLASGKRQHGAITLTRLVGESSPQLFAAVAANDVIKTVTIDFLRPDSRGQDVLAYSIRLTNAQISEITQYFQTAAESADSRHVGTGAREALFEDVSFTFQRIDITSPGSKTSAADEWR